MEDHQAFATAEAGRLIDEKDRRIAALRAELAAKEADLDSLRDHLDDMRAQWAADAGTLGARLMTAEARVTALERDLNAALAEAARLRELANDLIDKLKASRSKANEISHQIDRALRPEMYDAETTAALRGPAQSEQP